MASLAGSYYLLSTVAFCLISMAIGVRLALLSHRTGARPELYLGVGLFLSGGLGYALVIGSAIAGARVGPDVPVIHVVGLAGLGIHHVGAAFSLAFVVMVFRPTERWARALAAALVGVLEDEPRRVALGVAARGLALERYAWPDLARRLTEVYESVAGRTGAVVAA